MRTAHVVTATLACALLIPGLVVAAPQDEAIAKYREYVAAIRDGQVENALAEEIIQAAPAQGAIGDGSDDAGM